MQNANPAFIAVNTITKSIHSANIDFNDRVSKKKVQNTVWRILKRPRYGM